MKAYTKSRYGGPEVLQIEEVDMPLIKPDQVLVRISANSVNPADWHILRGKPFFARFTTGLFKPKARIPGADFSGIVEVVGDQVTQFKAGDRVFGETLEGGAFAEYAAVPEKVCALMPDGSSFREMAAIPIAGLTALQALVTHGKLKEGESVLINGSSGGVGHFSVQIAKAFGAHVTAVCSSRNSEFVRSLGADRVIAYDKENIHQHEGKYDLVVDTNGNLHHEDYKRIGQRGVMVGFTTMRHMITQMLKRAVSKFPLAQFTAEANQKDLATLATMFREGKIHPHIEKSFAFHDLPAAITYIEAMRTRGKVVVTH